MGNAPPTTASSSDGEAGLDEFDSSDRLTDLVTALTLLSPLSSSAFGHVEDQKLREKFMLSRVWSASLIGIDAVKVGVEVDVAGGLPAIVVVGLPDAAVPVS